MNLNKSNAPFASSKNFITKKNLNSALNQTCLTNLSHGSFSAGGSISGSGSVDKNAPLPFSFLHALRERRGLNKSPPTKKRQHYQLFVFLSDN